ncbi:MAG TPA: ATP-binding protein [Vicinamibacterales bacterium]|nr:ATP-binding protein [Vicinamibacterales bacterium]
MPNGTRVVAFARSPATATLATAVAYWIGTHIGLLLTPAGLAVSLMWPPNAILLAALLLTPVRQWPWYVLAILPVHLLTQLWHGIPLVTSVGWFATNITEALLGAFLLRRFRTARELFQTLSGVLLFLSIGVIGAAGLTSFLDAGVVVVTGVGNNYWDVWRQRFLSNGVATLTLVPAIVMLVSSISSLRTVRISRYVEATLLALGTLIVVNVLFARFGRASASIPPLIFTVLPLMFWAAVRFGPTGVSVLQIISTAGILWATLTGGLLSMQDVLSLQFFLALLNGLSLALSVVVRESRHLQSLHGAVLRSMRNAVAITDAEGVIIDANESWAAAERKHDPLRLDGVALRRNYLEQHRATAEHNQHAGRLVKGLELVLAGQRKLFEMEYVCGPPDQLRWFSLSIVPLWGEQRGAVITHSDITKRRREEAETLRLREELAHAGRVMTMGMLSASLTHELSQPLAAILGNAQAARRLCARNRADDTAEVDVILADVVADSRRAGSMLRKLRSWFSNGRHDTQELALNEVINDVIEILRGDLLRRGMTVTRRLDPRLPSIRGDRVQLQQVVLNLILNACDAMRENEPGDRHLLVMTTHGDDGVQLSVEDVGTGIAPDQLSTVFEPFVTTKAAGLGLGLALCRSIVHAHDGQLTAENNAGRGVTLRCTLPLADRQEEVAEPTVNGRGV